MISNYKLKILLIEDQEFSAQVALSFLKPDKCKVDRVKNGREAMNKLMKQSYDLIVLDWEMPIRNGSDVLKMSELVIKKSTENYRIPLVLYTGVEASKINIPDVANFQLVDFWSKLDSLSQINKRADNLINRLHRRTI